MTRNHVLTAIFALFVFSFAISAQQNADYSGTWSLDLGRSKIDERARVASISMVVKQNKKTIVIASNTVRSPRPDGSQSGTGGGGGLGGGGFGNGESTTTYDLSGKEIKSEEDSRTGKVAISQTAKQEVGKLILSTTRTSDSPTGPMTATITEEWTLSKDKKTLTVLRNQITPRSNNSSTLVFIKK